MDSSNQTLSSNENDFQEVKKKEVRKPVLNLNLEITIKTLLPDKWTVYIYDQLMAVKFARDPDYKHNVTVYPVICELTTMEEALWFMLLMKQDNRPKDNSKLGHGFMKNIDMYTYVIMRSHISPVWEDPHNKDGATWTVVTKQNKGFDIWNRILMYMFGEVLTSDCQRFINGISYAYIVHSEKNIEVNDSAYIKLWDGHPIRKEESEFSSMLPDTIREMVKGTSIRYKKNFDRNGFGNNTVSQKFERSIKSQKSGKRR